ncbi:SwmB domain-containing protein [Suttonella indologenes]|uniref:Cyanobacterial long protein repeat n=1 Tax=Suttonella indologenes TaxID=13276 RepID=A0A380N0U7_9GAMM|nr:SwmB domain-containing protein [Suttonella indologenes]SUO98182.1 cyanobacterial long protein repeat [Suttonella indologenes]
MKDPQSGNWTATDTNNGNPISNTASDTAPSIDSNTGTVTIPGTIVKDSSEVKAVSQDDAGNTSSDDLSFSAPKLPVELNMQAGEYNPSAKTYDAKISVALKKGADKVVFSMPGGGAFTLTEEDLARLDEDGNAINGYSFDLHKLAIDTRLTNFDNVLYGQVLAQIKQGQKLSVVASKTGYNDGTDDSNLSASPTVTSTPTGGATVKIADDAGETIITYKDSNTGDDRTITVSNGVATLDNGTRLPAESPKGAEPSFDLSTGTVRIPASQVQDHTDVKAETTKDSGGNPAPSLPEQGTVLGENNKPKVVAEDDGSATITPTASATEVITDYTDEKGDEHKITTTKQPDGTWAGTDKKGNLISDMPSKDKPSIDPKTGTVTLPPAAVKDGSTVIAEQTGPDGTGSDSSSTIEDNTPKPEVSAEKNGDVIIRPNDKAIFSTTTYTDDEGNTHQIEAKKDPSNNTWAATDKTMGNNPIATAPNGDKPWIDPNTGVISIPDKAVKDGTDVGASQVIDDNGNRKSSGEATATAKTPPAINTADVDADDKGNVTISPSGDATGTNTSYVGEDDKPKTIVATKDPNTGKWTGTDQDGNPISDTPSKDKPSIDPNTGVISIPDSAVKDNSTVETTQETPDGTSRPSTAITNGDIPPADIDAKEDGSVKVKPTEDATGVNVSYEDENGKPQTITTTKQPDGTWKGKDQVGNPISDMPSKDKPSIDPNTGTVTLPPTAVKDGSTVTATQDTPAGTSKDSSATAKDNIPEPEVKAHEDASVTIKPSEDASSTTTNYVDDKDLPNTIMATKDPNTGKWTAKNQDDKALDTTPSEQYPWIDPNTGIISIPDKAVKDGSIVSAQQETPAGTSGKDTAVASTAPDTTPPKITDAQVSSDGKSIVLSYDENLGGTKASTDMFTVKLDSGKTVTVTDVSIKDKEVTLKLNTPIYQGDNVSIDYSSGDKKHQDPSNPATQDKAGNDADDLSGYTVSNGSSVTEPSLNITHAIDNVDPQTGNVMHDGHSNDKTPTLVITLDRDLEEGEVVTVYDKAGTKLGEATAETNAAGGTEYHFTTAELSEDTAEFTAKVHKGKDLVTSSNNFSLNIDLTAPDYKATVEIQDGGDGIINAAEKEADVKVNITAPAEAKEGDVIEVKVGNDVIATYTVGKDIKAGKSKEADIPTGKIPADGKDALKVTATITDKAGNTGEASEATATVDTTPPSIDGTPTIDKTGKELKIPFNEELKGGDANAPTAKDFTITVNGTNIKPDGVSIKDKEVTLRFNTPIAKDAEVTLAYTDSTPTDAAGIVDTAGNSNTSITQGTTVSNGSSVTKPSLNITHAIDDVDPQTGNVMHQGHSNDKTPTLVITLNRTLEEGEVVTVYDKAGTKLGEATAETNAAGGTEYHFTTAELSEGIAEFTAKIVDANGKEVASSGEFSLNIDGTAPILDNMKVEILDGGDNYINAAEKKAGVKVRVTASPKAVEGDIIKLNIGGKTKEITIGKDEGQVAPGEFIDIPVDKDQIKDGETLNVEVVKVKDQAGNTASNDTLKDSSTVNLTAPTRTANEPSIDASGKKITIPYDENLATGDKAPEPAAFTVTKNGSTVTPNSVTVNGNNIELNFTIPFVSTDNVKVAYTDPSAGDDTKAIQDAAGNDAATFAAKEVKNNSTKEAPAINIHTIAGQSEAQDKGSSKHIDSDGYARLTDKLIKSGFEIAGTAENIANGTDVKVQILDEKGAAIWTETVKVADKKWNATVVPKAINDFDSTKVYKVKAEATVNGESKIDEDLLKSPIKIENLQGKDDVGANTSPTPAGYSGGHKGTISNEKSTSYTELKTGLTNDKKPEISFEIDRELAEGESVVVVRQAVSRDSKGDIIGKSAEQTVHEIDASNTKPGTKKFSFTDNLEDSYGTEYIYTAKVIDKTGVLAKKEFSIKLDTMIEAFDTETVVQSDRNGTTITGTAEKGAKITLTYRNTDGTSGSQPVNVDDSGKFNLTLPSTWDRKSKNAQLVIEDQAGNVSSVNLYTIRNLYTDLNTKKGLTFATIDNINGFQRMDSDPKKAIIMSVEGDWIFIRENLGGQAGSIKPNIDMAGGDDYLYVPNTITSGPQIDMGAGNDKIQIGGGLATGKYTFNLGNGNDILDIGKDVVNLAFTNVDAGDGSDLIRVGSHWDGGGDVKLGQGNDEVIVNGYIAGSKKFYFDAGDDSLIVNDKGTGGISIFGLTKIDMGDGNDTVMLAGNIGSSVHKDVRVDGGEGNDSLFFTGSGVHTSLDRVFNFETIDLTGTGNNRLDVSISAVKLNGNTTIDIDGISYTGLFINGNEGDTVDLGANGGSVDRPNFSNDFKEYTGDNKPKGYNAYWNGSDKETMVYIQDGISII